MSTTRQIIRAELIKLAEEAVTITDAGDIITRAQLLGQMLWKYALGFKEETEGGKENIIKPAPWAISMLCDRIDGKVVTKEITRGKSKIPLSDKIDSVRKDGMNSFTEGL